MFTGENIQISLSKRFLCQQPLFLFTFDDVLYRFICRFTELCFLAIPIATWIRARGAWRVTAGLSALLALNHRMVLVNLNFCALPNFASALAVSPNTKVSQTLSLTWSALKSFVCNSPKATSPSDLQHDSNFCINQVCNFHKFNNRNRPQNHLSYHHH